MSTLGKKLRRLQRIYDQVPIILCKGHCTNQCSVIPLSRLELTRMENGARRRLPILGEYAPSRGRAVVLGMNGDHCQMLVNGRCSAYDDRPLICRLYGVAEGLPCQHGCIKMGTLTDYQVDKMLRAIAVL